MTTAGETPRPRDLALALLASPDLRPRQRARDQRADVAGLELQRRVLERLASLDPEAGELEGALMRIVEEFGPPLGPTRAIATLLREEWQMSRVDPPYRPQVTGALAELTKLAGDKPSLAAPCAVLRDILLALFSAPSTEVPPVLDPAQAQEKLAAGIPLLRGEKMDLDSSGMRRRWLAVCTAAGPSGAAAASAFDKLDPVGLLAEVLEGRPEAVHARADELELDAALTATSMRLAFLPVLDRFACALQPLRHPTPWEHGCCPTCGSWPLLGEFRGLEQTRHLRCGVCASGWQFPRLRCPFCGNSDHRQLGFFHVEHEEARYRAATCDACHGYVEMVSTLDTLTTAQLLVSDLATLHLDLAAADRGYFVA